MSNEQMVDGEDVTRRDMLRKAAVGAGMGAAVVAAPSITGLSVAPLFASAQSCVPNLTTNLTFRITNVGLNVDVTVSFVGTVVDNGDGTCTVNIATVPDPGLNNVDIAVSVTLSNGEMFTDTFNPNTGVTLSGGGTLSGTFTCAPGEAITIATVTGLVADLFPLAFEILAQDEIVVC